jgi:hypothetical protein
VLNFACNNSALFNGPDERAFITLYGSLCAQPEDIVFFNAAGNGWRRAVRVISMSL